MIDDSFRIYIDQLRDGHTEELEEVFSPDFLGIEEADLKFSNPIHIAGQAYLADDMLVLHLDINTFCQIPCRMCNELVKVDLDIEGVYFAIPVDEIKSGIFDFQELLRESVLLEVPQLAECCQGNCPEREKMQGFLKKESLSNLGDRDDEGYRPFENLEFKE